MFQVNPLLNQALFSSKDKGKKLKCRLLQFLFSALRVKLDNSFTTVTRNLLRFCNMITTPVCGELLNFSH